MKNIKHCQEVDFEWAGRVNAEAEIQFRNQIQHTKYVWTVCTLTLLSIRQASLRLPSLNSEEGSTTGGGKALSPTSINLADILESSLSRVGAAGLKFPPLLGLALYPGGEGS